MAIYKTTDEIANKIKGVLNTDNKTVSVLNKIKLKASLIDELVYNLLFAEDEKVKGYCGFLIWEAGQALGIYPSSINDFYMARPKDKFGGFTVPAVNIRGLTYDVARALIRTAIKNNSLAFIFEIARSEINYTFQRPKEYTLVCIAAAIKEAFSGPLFIQGDHCQIVEKQYLKDSQGEIGKLKNLIKEEIEAGFYNIDIDSSTMVDLSKPTTYEQQRLNFEMAAEITAYIRSLEPKGITVSVGGEIGEVGGKNSTPDELDAFMKGYIETLNKLGKTPVGISKISVQTGTSHGGVVLPDGSIAKVNLDFDTLKTLSKVAKEKYGLAGAVQHGASTLPAEAFHKFPETETAEVHLATEFQNMVYESKYLPADLKHQIYEWLKANCAKEKEEGQTEEQFIYKARKKGLGPFKKQLHDLPQATRDRIAGEIEAKFEFLFKKLNVVNTKDLVNKYIKAKQIRYNL